MAWPIARTRSATDLAPVTAPGRSLTPKLVLLIGGLIVAVTLIDAAAAFVELRGTAYVVASDRLTALRNERARGMVASRRPLGALRQAIAERPALRASLAQPSPALRPAAESALRTAFALVARVGASEQPDGYVVQWRRLRLTGLDQLSRLVGGRPDVYPGDRTGGIGTDLVPRVEPPGADVSAARARRFRLQLWEIGGVIFALGLAGAIWLRRRLTRPLVRMADAAPRAAEESYRRLFESVPLPLWVIDRDSLRFLAVNDAARAHYGYRRDEFLSMTIADIGDTEDLPRLRDSVRRYDAAVEAGETWRHRTKAGAAIDVETRACAIVFGGRNAAIVVVNDVTERSRTAEATRRSEEKYQTLVHEAPTGITLSTLDGRLLAANPAFVEMIGFASEADALAVDTRELYQVPGARADLLATLGLGTRLDRKEVVLKRTDGSLITVLCTMRLVTDPSSGEPRIEAILLDVTEQRKIEGQFQQAQKMEAVGQLAGGIAHDFNNLLTVIVSYSDLLLSGLDPDDARREDVLAIRLAGKSAATLTRQLLIFSRQQVVQPAVMHLNDLVIDTKAMLSRLIDENIVLQTALDPAAGAVKVDPGQIEQVIINLAVNARDAMPEGGRLLIESKNVTFDEGFTIRNRLYPAGRYVSLVVSDTGVGMDEETQSRIFEPFFTTKEPGKGTGLGLATVYGIVKQSGGHISVYSEPGKGTSFQIYFPRIDDTTEPVRGVRSSGPEARGTETLLVVEDDETVRKMVRVILERQGYVVLAVPNGEEALALATSHGGPIDLLVTDVVMPGISGRVLADRFAALRPESRLLFVSGYTDDALVHHGVLVAGTHYLEKPFTPDSLSRMVRRALDSALA